MVHDPNNPVSTYLSKIGTKGGKVVSEAKRRANKLNAQKRWATKREKIFTYIIKKVKTGMVHYVGQTNNPTCRMAAHRNAKGAFSKGFKMIVIGFSRTQKAASIKEGRLIKFLRKKGHPLRNKMIPNGKCLKSRKPIWRCIQTGELFYNYGHIARINGNCVAATVRRYHHEQGNGARFWHGKYDYEKVVTS